MMLVDLGFVLAMCWLCLGFVMAFTSLGFSFIKTSSFFREKVSGYGYLFFLDSAVYELSLFPKKHLLCSTISFVSNVAAR